MIKKSVVIISFISTNIFGISPHNIYNDALAKRLSLDTFPTLENESDEVELVYNLELVKKIGDIINQETGFIISNGCDQKIMYQMVSLFFCDCSKKDLCQQLAFLSTGSLKSCEKIYLRVQKLLYSVDEIIVEVKERIQSEHADQDTYERKMIPHHCRSLAKILSSGIHFQCPPCLRKDIITKRKKYGCTILEAIKNEKLATINEFAESKMALMIHDCFDHMYVYNEAQHQGILDRYITFLDRIGNPHLTDIFNRAGEFLASVGFEFRFFHLNETSESLFSFQEIKNWFAIEDMTENQCNVHNLLHNAIDPEFKQGVATVISNILIELMEQRRKFGFVYDFHKQKPLAALDLELITFLIESYHMLYRKKEVALQCVFAIYCMFEEYLETMDIQEDEFIITLNDIASFSIQKSCLSQEKLCYVKENLASISNRRSFC